MTDEIVTAPMEFASEADLQAFLAQWLEEHGHQVYREVKCPDGGAIDILTQVYTIECKRSLTRSALFAAAGQLRTYEQHFPGQKPVIAGLTPTSDSDEIYKIVDRLTTSGLEVWFVDQMPSFLDYYQQLTATTAAEDGLAATNPPRRLSRRNPLAGCAIALGMAAILTVSFWLAYRILERNEAQIATTSRTAREWERLHAAVAVWDMDTTRASLTGLAKSRDFCTAEFAKRFEDSLDRRGPEGFRDINPIKRALNQQEGCTLDIVEFDFSK